ncbi:MAG: hypothetical protein L6R41_002545 [Letrouitia leprolyta]|nr:MAG: hypothetical protein L6R41_002545 [Letrouitia leprolyta]
MTLSEIQRNSELWYRVHVLLHDLNNIGHDIWSEKRLLATTNELYISAPYFIEAEATQILSALVEPRNPGEESNNSSLTLPTATVQDTIHQRLANFFDKRKASGDSRPCGPHDMLPIYLDVFKLQKGALEDEKFLRRLRRSGLGDSMSKGAGNDTHAGDSQIDMVKKGKKGKKGR